MLRWLKYQIIHKLLVALLLVVYWLWLAYKHPLDTACYLAIIVTTILIL